jgi:hypothetical protein
MPMSEDYTCYVCGGEADGGEHCADEPLSAFWPNGGRSYCVFCGLPTDAEGRIRWRYEEGGLPPETGCPPHVQFTPAAGGFNHLKWLYVQICGLCGKDVELGGLTARGPTVGAAIRGLYEHAATFTPAVCAAHGERFFVRGAYSSPAELEAAVGTCAGARGRPLGACSLQVAAASQTAPAFADSLGAPPGCALGRDFGAAAVYDERGRFCEAPRAMLPYLRRAGCADAALAGLTDAALRL